MPFLSTYQRARTRRDELLAGTVTRPNGGILLLASPGPVHPLPLPAVGEGHHSWDHLSSVVMGKSTTWGCLFSSLLCPAQCWHFTEHRPLKQTPGHILDLSLPSAIPCTMQLTLGAQSSPPLICQMAANKLPFLRREWCVVSGSLFHQKVPRSTCLAGCQHSTNTD